MGYNSLLEHVVVLLQEKNFLPQREQILSCKSVILKQRNEVEETVPTSRFHISISFQVLTLLHSERPKLHTILAFLSAIGLNYTKYFTVSSIQLLKYSPFSNMKLLMEIKKLKLDKIMVEYTGVSTSCLHILSR